MIHTMHLAAEPFGWIKDGKKASIEVRLFDEKRRMIAIGDTIIFKKLASSEETVEAHVKALLRFESFRDLFSLIPRQLLGHEGLCVDQQVARMRKYYSEEEEKKYGVLGIWFEVVR
jgi:ASC-1-like (ASCH) protein